MDKYPDRRLLLTAILAQPALSALFSAKAVPAVLTQVPGHARHERIRSAEAAYFEQCWG